MNRIEELTLSTLEGGLSEEESRELADLVSRDAAARETQRRLLELEAALRFMSSCPDVSESTVRFLQEREDRAVHDVLGTIRTLPLPDERPRRRPWVAGLRRPLSLAILGSAVAALAAVGVVALTKKQSAKNPSLTADASAGRFTADERASRSAVTVGRGGGGSSIATGGVGPSVGKGEASSEPAPAERDCPLVKKLYHFDFEDGVLPGPLILGVIVPSPERPTSEFSIMGVVDPYAPSTYSVAVDRLGKGFVLAYSARVVVAFDYLVGPEATAVTLQVSNHDKRRNYAISLPDAVKGRWARATIRVADLRPYVEAPALEEGDALYHVLILGGRFGGQPLYIDDFEIVEFPIGSALPPTTAASPPGAWCVGDTSPTSSP